MPRHVSAVLSSVVRSVGKVCLLHGKHALGGGTGGKITLALLWRHLAAQVPAEGPSALLRPQPRFSFLFRNTLLCRPERALLFFPVRRGCSGPGKLRSRRCWSIPPFRSPRLQRRCATPRPGRSCAAPAAAAGCPLALPRSLRAQRGRERGWDEGGGGAAAASAGAAARLGRQQLRTGGRSPPELLSRARGRGSSELAPGMSGAPAA